MAAKILKLGSLDVFPRHLDHNEPADVQAIEKLPNYRQVDGLTGASKPGTISANHRRERTSPCRCDQHEAADCVWPVHSLVQGVGRRMTGYNERMRFGRDFIEEPVRKAERVSGVQLAGGRGKSPKPGQSTAVTWNARASKSSSGRISARVEIELRAGNRTREGPLPPSST